MFFKTGSTRKSSHFINVFSERQNRPTEMSHDHQGFSPERDFGFFNNFVLLRVCERDRVTYSLELTLQVTSSPDQNKLLFNEQRAFLSGKLNCTLKDRGKSFSHIYYYNLTERKIHAARILITGRRAWDIRGLQVRLLVAVLPDYGIFLCKYLPLNLSSHLRFIKSSNVCH